MTGVAHWFALLQSLQKRTQRQPCFRIRSRSVLRGRPNARAAALRLWLVESQVSRIVPRFSWRMVRAGALPVRRSDSYPGLCASWRLAAAYRARPPHFVLISPRWARTAPALETADRNCHGFDEERGSRPGFTCAGEGTCLVTEQLRLEQLLGNSRAIEGHQRALVRLSS